MTAPGVLYRSPMLSAFSATPTPAPGPGTSFTATQNLLGTQFNPAADPRLAATQGQVGALQGHLAAGGGQVPGAQQAQNLLTQAAGYATGPQVLPTTDLFGQAQQQVQGAQLGPLGSFGQDVGAARQQTLQALGALGSAPSRSETAQNLYDALTARENANSAQALQGLGRRAAALGQLGSGMVTSEAGDIFGQRQANLAAIKAGLAAQTAGQEQQDLLNRVGAAQNVTQGLGGLDLSRAGLGLQAGTTGANLALQRAAALQGLGQGTFEQQQAAANLGLQRAGQLAGLAGEQFGLGQGQLGAQQSVLGQLAGLEGQQFGQNLGRLGFLQGERQYQTGEEQRAIDNALQQFLTQQGAQQQAFGQQQTINQLLAGLGQYGGSPTELAIADQYGGQAGANQEALSGLLGTLGAEAAGSPTASALPSSPAGPIDQTIPLSPAEIAALPRLQPRY